jgi:hypothetical protein
MHEAGVMLVDLVIWSTLGLLLSALGFTLASWEFWCVLALFWAMSRHSWTMGHQLGLSRGVLTYLNMTEQQQNELKKKLENLK